MSAPDVDAVVQRVLSDYSGMKVSLYDAQRVREILSAAGWVVVPREPTREMILAAPGRNQQATEESMYHGIYRAMIAAVLPAAPEARDDGP